MFVDDGERFAAPHSVAHRFYRPITGPYSDSPDADVAALVKHAACAVLVDDSTTFTIKNNGFQFPAGAHFRVVVPFLFVGEITYLHRLLTARAIPGEVRSIYRAKKELARVILTLT